MLFVGVRLNSSVSSCKPVYPAMLDTTGTTDSSTAGVLLQQAVRASKKIMIRESDFFILVCWCSPSLALPTRGRGI